MNGPRSKCWVVMSAAIMLAVSPGCRRSNQAPTSTAAVKALESLGERDGVAWHEVEGNSVFVGFLTPLPKDWKEILEEAAITGSSATQHEFHATGIQAEADKWRGFVDSYSVGGVTARNAEIID